MPQFGTPSHIDLSVSDVEATARWYCDVLGLRRLRRVDLENRIMVVLVHRETGLIVGLNQHATIPLTVFDDRNVGLDHIGFNVAQRSDLDLWATHLEALDVVHSPAQDTPNGSALVFRDPDNIQLEFWWTRLPVSKTLDQSM